MNLFCFVGGPADGKVSSVPEGRDVLHVLDGEPFPLGGPANHVTYHLRRYALSGLREFSAYVCGPPELESIEIEELWERNRLLAAIPRLLGGVGCPPDRLRECSSFTWQLIARRYDERGDSQSAAECRAVSKLRWFGR